MCDQTANGKRLPGARVCLALLLSLLAGSCAHANELQPVLAKAASVPEGPNDFGFIDPIAKGRKILFIGEAPHHDSEIIGAGLGLAVHLRQELDYSVVARETMYSERPWLETRSLGGEGDPPNVIPESERLRPSFQVCFELEPIAVYNRGAPKDKRLLCTAIDLDHGILMNQPMTVWYLAYLASKSSSAEVKADLAKGIPALYSCNGLKEIRAYLDGLERRFRVAWDTFSSADQEEIAFSLALERASTHYTLSQPWKYEARSEYYRKTVERALAKAESSSGALVCLVGGYHARLDPPSGMSDEARYFRKVYPASSGRVASILIERLSRSQELHNEFTPTALEQAALARMGDKDRIFINLRDQSWNSLKRRPKELFPKDGPNFDGVLFIR